MMNFVAQSQISTQRIDTCYGSTVVRKLLVAAQRGEILQDEVATLNARIVQKEKQLSASNTRDSLLMVSLKAEIVDLNDQKGLAIGELNNYKKLLKKEKRKRTLTGIAGMLTTAAAFYIGSR